MCIKSFLKMYSLCPMKGAILSLKKSHKECNSRDRISINCLIKWLDLNCMSKLTICGKQLSVWKSFHATTNLFEKNLELHFSWDRGSSRQVLQKYDDHQQVTNQVLYMKPPLI